jgi:hypothetical protein
LLLRVAIVPLRILLAFLNIIMTNLDCNKENVSLIQYINCDDNLKSVANNHQQQQQQQQQPVDWVDTVVNCANIMNKIFTRNTCRLCHIYSDKQVEFEERIQQNATITATAAEWYNLQQQGAINFNNNNDNELEHDTIYQQQSTQPSSNHLDEILPSLSASSLTAVNPEAVELYRKYLFDEESVVDSIEMRIGRSTDEEENDEMKDVQLI